MQVRSSTASGKPDPLQLSMFDVEIETHGGSNFARAPVKARSAPGRRKPVKAPTPTDKSMTTPPIRVVAVHDLPSYPKSLIEQVDGSMTALPSEKLWFTYNEIRRYFGVSRATVARRMREGLVPGLRFQDGRMLEDGAVRRLDREQLRWLLLSVRCDRDRRASFEQR